MRFYLKPGAADVGAQHTMASRQSMMMGAMPEADLSGYRAHSAQGAQYGGPYAALYGSAALSKCPSGCCQSNLLYMSTHNLIISQFSLFLVGVYDSFKPLCLM